MFKRLLSIGLLLLLLMSCVTTKFKSNEELKNNTYFNYDIGFSIKFNEQWNIWKNLDETPQAYKEIVKNSGIAEDYLLYFGLTKNNLIGCRAMAERLDLDIEEYSDLIIKINEKDITNYTSETKSLGNREFLFIRFEMGTSFVFYEYFIKQGEWDVRLSFWTTRLTEYKLIDLASETISSYSPIGK